MRKQAKASRKYSPTVEELEELLAAISDMLCPVCHRQMHWSGADGMDGVITLQHDRDNKTIRLMCGACNSHHRNLPGDLFYDMIPGTKFCPGCREIKSVAEFARDRHKASKCKSLCKKCSYEKWKAWFGGINRKPYYRKKWEQFKARAAASHAS